MALADIILPKGAPDSGASWWLGTVVGINPLRVRRDNEAEAAGVTPDSLVTGLVEGERVQMVTHFGRPVVVGRLKARVESGSHSSRGDWVRYPDGRQEVSVIREFPGNASTVQSWTWTFPQPFRGAPSGLSMEVRSSRPDLYAPMSYLALTSSSVETFYYRTSNTAASVLFSAWGRWR